LDNPEPAFLTALERQLGPEEVKFAPEGRALLAALLARLPPRVPDDGGRGHRRNDAEQAGAGPGGGGGEAGAPCPVTSATQTFGSQVVE
jgi:hypothetical protein